MNLSKLSIHKRRKWAGDSCTFELYKLAKNEIAVVNSQLSMLSPDWWESTHPVDFESTLSQEAQLDKGSDVLAVVICGFVVLIGIVVALS